MNTSLRFSATLFTVALFAALLATTSVVGAQGRSCDGQAATIVGTSGADTLMGTEGNDVIVALGGNDTIRGLGGDDIICAGGGRDTVWGGLGSDVIFGGQGNDTIFAANGAGALLRVDVVGDEISGGVGNDRIFGSNRADDIDGDTGDDLVRAYQGLDTVRGGDGNDLIDGGPGADELRGESGRDNLLLSEGDEAFGGAGFDLCRVLSGTPASVESCGLGERESAPPPPEPIPLPGRTIVGQFSEDVELASCNASAETVVIVNNGTAPISLTGWTIHDEGNNFEAVFGVMGVADITLQPGQQLTLLSGDGPDQAGTFRLFDRDIWNNTGDVATLLGPNGELGSTTDCR